MKVGRVLVAIVAIAAVAQVGLAQAGATAPAGDYVPVAPARLMDTRDGTGGHHGPLSPYQAVSLQVAGVGGVPAAALVDSVLLNVTVTDPTGYGFLSVYPAGGTPPNASNLNFVPGQTVPNMVSAKLSADGKVSFLSNVGTQVVADVVGYYSSATGAVGARLLPITPTRYVDTRDGLPVLGGGSLNLCAFGDLPLLDSVEGMVLNVTAVDASGPGFVRIWPTDQPMPPTSNLNVAGPSAVPNMVVVKPDSHGCVLVNTNIDQLDLVIDLSGVFYDSGLFPGPAFTGQAPTRVLDTRNGTGAPAHSVGAWQTVTLDLSGKIPADTAAVILNVTVTQPTGTGYVTVWPSDDTMPEASNLNFVPGQTVPNLVLVPVSADGKVNLQPSANTHLIADLAGYFF
jgi:hypothetical protein